MFTGESWYTVDQKGRVSVPAKYRDELGNDLMLCKGFDVCLLIYPRSEWEIFANKMKQLPDASQRHAKRYFFSGTTEAVLDAQGRIAVPPAYRQFASLEKDIVIIGNDDHLEIWSASEWEKEQQNMSSGEVTNDLISCGF